MQILGLHPRPIESGTGVVEGMEERGAICSVTSTPGVTDAS